MNKFNFIKTDIKDLYIIEQMIFEDDRGYFMETYNKNDFFESGLKMTFVQDNQSKSKQGVLRGLHFQSENPQGKLVRVLEGEVFDVAVDLRKNSETFGKWHGIILSNKNKKQFYIPEGFAHGFLVLSKEATFSYKCTNFYSPKDESGIIWNDTDININWPIENKSNIILSEKDIKLQSFEEYCKNIT